MKNYNSMTDRQTAMPYQVSSPETKKEAEITIFSYHRDWDYVLEWLVEIWNGHND